MNKTVVPTNANMTNAAGVKILETIEKSALLSAEVLQKTVVEWEERCAQAGTNIFEDDGSRSLLEFFVASGRLTNWQAAKLQDGRHKGFFLGSYRLLNRLGAGGMSTVYLAEHVHMRQLRALKVLPRHRVGDSSYLERFYREARAAAALDHPNVVHAYDVGCDDGTHYLVMEYVEGSDLQKVVARRGVLSYDSTADVVRQTAEGLAHAHKAGVIHRDIKPANLLLDPSGLVKILDMGLARHTAEESEKQASLTQLHDENVIGTTNYLAPEQALHSHSADARSDLYSLGCTMYYLLTGLPPFSTGTVAERLMAHIHQKPEPVTKHRPNVPESLAKICAKLLEKKPDDRYQSSEELASALKAWRKEWLTQGGAESSSGVQVGVPFSGTEQADEVEVAGSGSMRDTDAVRAQATSIGRRSTQDDDELQLADVDDIPKSKGAATRRPTAPSKPASGSSARKTSSPRQADSSRSNLKAPKKVSDTVNSAAIAAPANSDFLDEIMSAASAPAPATYYVPPTQRSGGLPAARPGRPMPGAPSRSPSSRRDVDDGDVKSDVENLFRKHPGFAALVFLFFSLVLVFGLYYMIRTSAESAVPDFSGTARD
ncbi:MAG: hypothetical protein C0483_02125 [Pirellula sp.]|nr:hypothetical protein [Pirellula sp.]